MRVTLDVYSGRPNPTWRLTAKETKELVDRVAGKAVRSLGEVPAVLGYRGFVVQADPDDALPWTGLPPRFTVGRPGSAPAAAETVPRAGPRFAAAETAPPAETPTAGEEADLTRWLCETAKTELEDSVLDAVRGTLSEDQPARSARGLAATPARDAGDVDALLAASACRPFLTPMDFLFWNQPSILWRNNCYNYASNFVSNTLAQPGRRSGHIYSAFECEAVAAAAMADGCLTECNGRVRVVALAIWPGTDFHWWRLHPNGLWAHKLGWTSPTDRDNAGRLIGNGLTPETCDRRPYTTFCGYYYPPLEMWVL